MDASLSSLSAMGLTQAVTAHNLANVNTEGFAPSRVVLEDQAGMGGVGVAAVVQDPPPVPEYVQAPMQAVPQTAPGLSPAQFSGTDVAREMVSMIQTEHAFSANAAMVRTQDEMLGSVMDIVV